MEELSYHEKRILTMEYFDTELSKKRKFYTLNIKEVDSGYAGAVLFEIIMEMKDFAVLSKRYAVQKARESSGGYREDARDAKIGYQQFESIYLVDDEAKVELLWTANVFDRGNAKPLTSPVPPFLDQDVLSKFTGSKWREVKDYIKEKRLHIKERADLLEALAYYKQLEPTE